LFADGRLYSDLVRKGSAHGSIIGDQRGNECPHCGPDDPRRICSTDLDKVGAAVDIAQRKVSKRGHGKSLSRAIYLRKQAVGYGGSVSRVAWNLGDDPWWTLGGGTDAFGAGVGVSLEGGDELGHLLVAFDAAE
jgi:hypothetical protein